MARRMLPISVEKSGRIRQTSTTNMLIPWDLWIGPIVYVSVEDSAVPINSHFSAGEDTFAS